MPLTFTVETFSRAPEGAMADAALRVATIKARPAQARPEKARPEKAQPHFAMPPEKTARFPRTARLLRHADFERVYKQGRRHFSASFTVFYWPRPEAETRKPGAAPTSVRSSAPTSALRVGFTVGRALGGAVQRNRMKRRLREAVRSLPQAGVAADVVINPKKSLLTADFAALVNEVARAFTVIEQKLSQNPPEKAGSEASAKKFTGRRKPKAGSRS